MSARRVVLTLPTATREPVGNDEPQPCDDAQRLARFVARLSRAGFFGKLTLSFQNGKITNLCAEQVMKLDEI